MKKSKMILFNILAVLLVGIFVAIYSYLYNYQLFQVAETSFESTNHHTMEIFDEYMHANQQLVNSWAEYIDSQNMTIDDAITFVRNSCHSKIISAQILWSDTYCGLSTLSNPILPNDYTVEYGTNINEGALYIPTMKSTISNARVEKKEINITSSYTNPVTGSKVVSFLQKITLQKDGKKKEAILLLALPVSYLKENWKFTLDQTNAEIALIEAQGTYVIQPVGMKNSNFFEYIDSYNHTTHDLKTLKETIQKTNSGSFYANNFKGENYFFSYAALSNDNGFFVITAIPKTSLNVNYTDWTILTIVFLALIVFLFVNIHYFMRVSEKENQTKELLQKQLHTIQKQENQLQESLSDALKANKSKSTFLFNMSHDIRTPMNAIIGFTDLMLKNLEDTEKLKHYLHKIQVSNEILYSLINNVLELARIESGKIHLENHVWNISELVDLTHTLFDDQMRSKGVNFTISTTVQHSIVYGDYTKIQEIFLNILSNAYKYSNPGGKVSIVIEEIPNENPDYTTHKTVITDTGIGMSAKFLEHIFDEFEREHTSTESKIVGSGLGMSIVKKLIDLMDGEIFVESKEGVGSCFTVILSHRIATKEAWEKSKEMSIIADDIDFHGKRVLLVEDNTLNAEIAISILEEMGFIVEHAEDGLICLDMLRTALPSYYNLILMDIQMPNLDGLETTRKIRMFDDRQKASIPIIAMTANAFEEDRKNCYAAGMNEHLSKPICIPELKALLKKCLSNISIE